MGMQTIFCRLEKGMLRLFQERKDKWEGWVAL